MFRIAIAVALTLLLGPGAGHLFLKKFKRAILLILATLSAAIVLAVTIGLNIPPAQLQGANPTQLFQSYIAEHPSTIFVFDAVFAAVWAYALVDAFTLAKASLPPPSLDSEGEEQ